MIKRLLLLLALCLLPLSAYADLTLTEGQSIDLTKSGVGGNLTVAFDSTEQGTTTWGSGSGIAWTFNAGATDPKIDFLSGIIAISTGNFGIGLTNPSYQLHVAGTIGSSNLVITGESNFANIVSGTWSGDVLDITKIPTIPLATKVSGTLPNANMSIISLSNSAQVSGTLPAANMTVVNLSGAMVSSTLPNANMSIVNLGTAAQVTGTLPTASLGIVPLGTNVSGTLPDASLSANAVSHIADASNPHGTTLTQTILNATTTTTTTLKIGDYYLPSTTGATNQLLKLTSPTQFEFAADNVGGAADYDNILINTNPAGQLQFKAGTSPAGNLLLSNGASGASWVATGPFQALEVTEWIDNVTLATTGNFTAPEASLNILTSPTIYSTTLLVADTDVGANLNTAYTHSQDNTQAHSDYLLNSGNDTTSGAITATGFYSSGNVGIGNSSPYGILSVATDPNIPLFMILSTGNIGIGTSNPTQQLMLTGNIDATTGIYDTLRVAGTDVKGALETNDTHRADASDPHGATLTQSIINATTGTFTTLLVADTNVKTALETNDTHRADSSDPHGSNLTQSTGTITTLIIAGTNSATHLVSGTGSFTTLNFGAGLNALPSGTGTAGQMLLGNMTWANTSPAGGGSTSFSGTTPQGILYISNGNTGAGSTLIVSDGSNLSVGIGTTANSARLYLKAAATSGNMNLRVADNLGADKLVILDNGNIGVGTTVPVALLDLRGAGTGIGIGLGNNTLPLAKLHIKSSNTTPAQGMYIENGIITYKSGGTCAQLQPLLVGVGNTASCYWLGINCP